jgi:hypothetical protein
VLSYAPATGTTVEVNGKSKGTLPGKATSDAIVRTWIGPTPPPAPTSRRPSSAAAD